MKKLVTMRSSSNPLSFHAFVSLLAAALLLAREPLLPGVHGAKNSGKVHLSGAKTESTLIKFAVSPASTAKIDLNITSYGMYEDEKELRFRIYVDEEWPRVKKVPLCAEKVMLSQRAVPVVFNFEGRKGDDRPGKKKTDMIETYTARIQHSIPNPPPAPRSMRDSGKRPDRSRYYYFVVDDCSLERSYHDGKIPDMFYTISVQNMRPSASNANGPTYSHLPADEDGIGLLLGLTIIFSGTLALLLFFKMARTIGGELHVAILVVMAACLANGLSALCEMIHMKAYDYDGHGIYSLDAFSSHFEALSDSMVSLVLLSIGGGWTLPADVVGGGMGGGAPANRLMKGLRNPAGSLLDLAGGDGSGGAVALLLVLVHAGLAQWGRTFDDDFDTYHQLEHPPGRALMALRFLLGLVFVTGVGSVRSGGRCPPSLMSFLTRFGLVGLSYYASLPAISTFVGSALPYHLRHQALHWGAALVQACSLASLTWLFAGGSDSSAYHRLSRAGQRGDGGADMTESIAASAATSSGSSGPRMWKFGKTKIRLD